MKKKIWGIGILILLGGIYFILNPSYSALFPKCPFLVLTGLKCPGCGSQRAIHQLLHLDFIEAFKLNALLVLSLPVIGVLLYAEWTRKRKPNLYIRLNNLKFMWGYFILVICWWIGRNIFQV